MPETPRNGPHCGAAAPPGSAAPRRPAVLGLLGRELRVALPLCVCVAAFMSLSFGDPFLRMLVYSLCIGLSIQALIEGGRYGLAAWQRRRRALRGEPGGRASDSEWPGWALMAPWVGVATVVGYGFGSTLADLVTGTQRTQGIFGGNPRVLVAILLVSISVSIAATYFFYARGRIAATEARFEAARRAALENQLMLLQSQLEPHMLFNTLANLRVLIGIDPPRAQAMLDRLIAYLRATLGGSRTGMHALADEFARLADYLALMAVRMGPRLQVQLDLPPELAGVQVPALLLQPLVENSIKHGLEPALEGGRIEVSARRDGARLTLAVRDTGAGLRDPAGPQYGTAHVRERLQALYGDAAHFSLEDAAGGGTLARVVLPAEALPGTA